MSKRRVVVTGLGMVCPVGLDVPSSWSSILAGKSGISSISRFESEDLKAQIAGELPEFKPSSVLSPKDTRKLDDFILYGVTAAQEAIEDSGLDFNGDNDLSGRTGIAIGSGVGGMHTIESSHASLQAGGPRKISPFFIPGSIVNMLPGYIAIKFGIKGPNFSVVTACASGTHNIGLAQRMIACGDADVVICGGAEMALTRLCVGGFASARALSTSYNDRPQEASRPWDKDRDGFVIAEGAGAMVLESLEHAQARDARIYAECSGFAMTNDAYHMTMPDPSMHGFIQVMSNTLKDAGVSPDQVNYINAHGTSTPALDPLEAQSVKACFGEHARSLAMSSTKSMTGHLLGAAGAIEAIFSVLAIRDQVAPPTINLHAPEEVCKDMNLVAHEAQDCAIDYALSNSFGFGGTNASLLFARHFS